MIIIKVRVDKRSKNTYLSFMHVNKKNLPKVQPVELKPIFGMKPGKWLAMLYISVFVLIVFLAGILPGILNGSKRVTFNSNIPYTAVYVDGCYAGGTPFTKKIRSGVHNVEYKINDFLLDSCSIKVGHPVFFTWLFPRSMKIDAKLTLSENAYRSLTSEFLNDVCSYSAVLSYDSVNHYPEIYTTYAKSVKDCMFFDENTFKSSLLFITTDEMKSDAFNACGILGLNITPDIASDSAENIQFSVAQRQDNGFLVNDSFYVSQYPVSEAEYKEFISANAEWAPENKANLIAGNLVDDYYLADFIGSAKRPVKNISWYAAKAYCEWKNVRLPSEQEWMIACSCSAADRTYQRTVASSTEKDEICGMLGGLWEMTDTFYVPGDRKSDSYIQNILKEYDVDCEIIVKGGSYINSSSDINEKTAGTAPRSMCSDFMGFRTVWD